MNWFKKISSAIIPMTAGEKNWAEWAIDPMRDYWCDEEEAYARDGDIYDESQIPRIEGNSLILSDVLEINEDLLYRLEEQSWDVTDSSDAVAGMRAEQAKAGLYRPAANLAKKIRGI